MEVRIHQIDGVKFSIEARAHAVVCDQPQENGGTDSGMTPPEFLLGSLGACAAFYAAEYLRTRKIATGGVAVLVTAEKLKAPARLGNFRIQVNSPVSLTAEQKWIDAFGRALPGKEYSPQSAANGGCARSSGW